MDDDAYDPFAAAYDPFEAAEEGGGSGDVVVAEAPGGGGSGESGPSFDAQSVAALLSQEMGALKQELEDKKGVALKAAQAFAEAARVKREAAERRAAERTAAATAAAAAEDTG